MTHVDSTTVQSLLQVGGHEASAEMNSGKNLETNNLSSHTSPLQGPPVPISRSDSVNTKPVPVPRRKSEKEASGESGSMVVHKETVMDKTGSLERSPPKLPPRPGNDSIEEETPLPPERVHTMTDHKTPPELPKRPCSTGENIDTTPSNPPTVPARTDLVNTDENFPVAPPRKGRKKIIGQ